MVGWSIPKGSLIVQNVWYVHHVTVVPIKAERSCSRAMSFDEEVYPKAQSFIPERHLAKDTPMDPKLYSFGIGRR